MYSVYDPDEDNTITDIERSVLHFLISYVQFCLIN